LEKIKGSTKDCHREGERH